MSQALAKVIRRFSAPLVFSRLKKEELCLSLAAVHLLQQSSGVLLGSSCVDKETQQLLAQQMTSKVRRVAPLCNAQEINMLASGVTALHCGSNDIVDVLVDTLYSVMGPLSNEKLVSSASMYVGTITAVAETAHQQKYLHHVTLKSMLKRATEIVAAAGERVPLLVIQNLWRVCPYFLSDEELQHVRDEMSRVSADVKGVVEAPPLMSRADALRNAHESEAKKEQDDVVQWSKEQGGRKICNAVQIGLDDVDEDAMSQLLELYGHFRLQDAAALEALEARALHIVAAPSSSGGKVKEVLFKYPHVFRTCVDALAQANAAEYKGDKGMKSLVPQGELVDLFADVLKGKRLSNERIQRLEQVVDVNNVNDVAMFANIVSRSDLSTLAQIQNSNLDALNGKGFCALVRLFVSDVAGVFEKTMQHVINTVNWSSLFRHFSLEESLWLADVLAAPVSREVRVKKSAALAREEVSLHLQHHFLAQMTKGAYDLATMCQIGVRCHAFDSDEQLVRFVLAHAKGKANLSSLSHCVSVLHLLSATGTYDEELLSQVETLVTSAVTKCCTSAATKEEGEGEGEEAEQMVQIMRIQAEYKAPELYGAMELLVRHADAEMAGTVSNAQMQLAAGFASLVLENDHVMQRVQDQLAARVERGVSVTTVKEICALLYSTSHTSLALLTRLAARVGHGDVLELMTSPTSPFQEEIVQLAVSHLRLRKVGAQVPLLADPVTQYVYTFVRALQPRLFVDLCECVSEAGGDLTATLVEALPFFLDRLSADEIGRCVYGLSDVSDAGQRLSHQLCMERVSTYVVDNISLFWDGPVICRMLRGFARFHCIKRSLYNVCAKQLRKRSVLFTLDRPSIGLALAAFGAVKYVDKELIDQLSRVYVEKADVLSTLDVVESVKALSRMMLMDKAFYVEMGQQITARAAALPFSVKCDLVQAYGHIGFLHEPMVEKLLLTMESETAQFAGANAAVDLLTSLWCLHHRLEGNKTVAATADYIVGHADELDPAHLVKLCSILVDLDWKHAPLLQAITTRATHLHMEQALPPHCSRAVLDTLDVFFIYSSSARSVLSESARGYSKQVPLLSEEEAQAVKQLLER